MNNKTIKFIAEVSVFSAVGLVLDFLAGIFSPMFWAQGGSISIAMIPIFLMGYRWGLKGGITTGLIVGTLQIIWAPGSYLIHPIQVILDYPLAYGVLGLSGVFANTLQTATVKKRLVVISISVVVLGLLRTIIHVVSGKYFWPPFDWIISIGYNIGYMLPSIILVLVILGIMAISVPHLVFATTDLESIIEDDE